MSNTAVGALYKRIIDQVIEASRSDFEENGVDNRMINTLQEKWQHHLSQRHPAHFPWDPQPPPSADPPDTHPPNSSRPPPAAAAAAAPAPAPTVPQPGPPVKQEPGSSYDLPGFPNLPQTGQYSSNPNVATQRAAHLLQQNYGNQAMNTISSLQAAGIGLPAQQRPGQPFPPLAQGGAQPGQQFRPNNPQQFAQQQQPQPQQQRDVKPQQPAQQPSNIKQESIPQVDGSGDDFNVHPQWNHVLAERAKTDSTVADGALRVHVESSLKRLEGGGLLVPLDEHYKRQRKLGGPAAESSSQPPHRQLKPADQPGRFDGADDDDEDDVKGDDETDVDAINSDLDDPDDEIGDGMVGEDYEGDMMICLFDKVQRVKNKWKCTLKDGIVNVDGKDYVFHKANGEFDW